MKSAVEALLKAYPKWEELSQVHLPAAVAEEVAGAEKYRVQEKADLAKADAEIAKLDPTQATYVERHMALVKAKELGTKALKEEAALFAAAAASRIALLREAIAKVRTDVITPLRRPVQVGYVAMYKELKENDYIWVNVKLGPCYERRKITAIRFGESEGYKVWTGQEVFTMPTAIDMNTCPYVVPSFFGTPAEDMRLIRATISYVAAFV